MSITVPVAWRRALQAIQQVHPEAIIAGGCLRDLYLDGEVKDVDVFIGNHDGHKLRDHLVALGWADHAAGCVPTDYVTNMRDEVAGVWGWIMPGMDIPVQIIGTREDPFRRDAALKRFDFYACRVGFDGFTVFALGDFYTDITNRRITLAPPVDARQAERSTRRGDRFRQKYAGTDVVVDVSAAEAFMRSGDLSPLA